MKLLKPSLLFLSLVVLPFGFSEGAEDPFDWQFDGSPRKVRAGDTLVLDFYCPIPTGHFLYSDKTGVALKDSPGLRLGRETRPPPVRREDPFYGKVMSIHEGELALQVPLEIPGDFPAGETIATLELSYQGCSESFCYRQVRRTIDIPLLVQGAAAPEESGGSGGEIPGFMGRGWPVRLGLSFLAGVASDFTPCVLPIIPITLAFIGVRRGGSRRKNFGLTLVFIGTMALTYAALGVAAASLGRSLGFVFQNVYFLGVVSLLYLLLALWLFGFFSFQLPLALRNRLARAGGGQRGIVASGAAGATTGLLAAPCIGPLIASLLIYIAKGGDLFEGFVLMLAYGLGMGSLFLAGACFYDYIISKIRATGGWTVWVKRILGLLLLLPAAYYGHIFWERLRGAEPAAPTAPVLSFWILDADQAFARAAGEGKPLLVDFYATWCLPCVEMERRTFSRVEVREAMAGVIPLKVDCTTETETCREMVDRYGVVGWPTVLLLSPEGRLLHSVAGKILSPDEVIGLISRYSQ